MIVYLRTKSEFQQDVADHTLDETIAQQFREVLGREVGASEKSAWRNSLPYMERVLNHASIPDDTGVAIEFNVPNTSRRIDFILTGKNSDGKHSAVIVELKQWETASKTNKDAIVETFLGGTVRETTHPSYQAWSYAMLVYDFNEAVREEPVYLRPCAYLHNCRISDDLVDDFYGEHLKNAPIFLRHDADKLRSFISSHIKKGDSGEALHKIRNGRALPSKSLADCLSGMLKGNQEFVLVDDQKVVYETCLSTGIKTAKKKNKSVVIVNGGPGTGKSVLAIHLLSTFLSEGLSALYVSKNSAPREVFKTRLAGDFKKSRIESLFVGSGKFHQSEADEYDVLIVDEAHRLNQKSGIFQNLGENQVKEIIEASHTSIFFLDECQRIHWKDIGSREEVLKWAQVHEAEVIEMELNSQFRCNGSDGYLAWLDHTLEIRETANLHLEGIDYQFEVCQSADELKKKIVECNQRNGRSRIVAGYCWEWISKKDKSKYDFNLNAGGFKARWNLSDDGMLWIVKPTSIDEVGCIHTCQGLELDYVGVIFGPDFLVRKGRVVTDGSARAKGDKSILGFKGLLKKEPAEAEAKADEIIKNTYRTLMTRGQKGCFIYSEDKETREYFENALSGRFYESAPRDAEVAEASKLRVTHFDSEKYSKISDQNLCPIFNLKAAAGAFSEDQWDYEADMINLPEPHRVQPGDFVVQVIGNSMNRLIPDGAWCLFRRIEGGTRDGKIVLVESRFLQEDGTQYTVKRYKSEKRLVDNDLWEHRKIILSPHSTDPTFQPIVLEDHQARELKVIGEFVAVLDLHDEDVP